MVRPESDCEKLLRLNALVNPGDSKKFGVFKEDFCLTDVVMYLWTFPEGLDSKASCSIWLVTQGKEECLSLCTVDKYGHQIHLNSGVFCPKGSCLAATSAMGVWGTASVLGVLLTGYYC